MKTKTSTLKGTDSSELRHGRSRPRGLVLALWALALVPALCAAQSGDIVRIEVDATGGASSIFGGGYLGLETSDLTAELREYFGVDRSVGVLVSKITSGSPAERGGARVGDVITRFAGQPVSSTWKLMALVRGNEPGDPVAIELTREGKALEIEVELEQRVRTALDVGALFNWEFDDGEGIHVLRFEGPADAPYLRLESEALETLKGRLEKVDWEGLSRTYRFEASDEETAERLRALEERLHQIEVQIQLEEDSDSDS